MRSVYTSLPSAGGVGGGAGGVGRAFEDFPRIQADADGGGFIERRQIAVEKDITHQLTSGLNKNIGQLYHKSCFSGLCLGKVYILPSPLGEGLGVRLLERGWG
jgi:hypothetical protein